MKWRLWLRQFVYLFQRVGWVGVAIWSLFYTFAVIAVVFEVWLTEVSKSLVKEQKIDIYFQPGLSSDEFQNLVYRIEHSLASLATVTERELQVVDLSELSQKWLPKEWLDLLPSLTTAAEKEPFYRLSLSLSAVNPQQWVTEAQSLRQWDGVIEVIYGRNTFELFSHISRLWQLLRHYILWGLVLVGVAVVYWLAITWYKLMQEELELLRSFGASWGFFLWPSLLFFLVIQGGAWLVTACVWFLLAPTLHESAQNVMNWLGGYQLRLAWDAQLGPLVLGSSLLFLGLFVLIQFLSLRRLMLLGCCMIISRFFMLPSFAWAETQGPSSSSIFYNKQKVEFELASIWSLQQQMEDKKKFHQQWKQQFISGLRQLFYQAYLAEKKDRSYLFRDDIEEQQARQMRVGQQAIVFWALRSNQTLSQQRHAINQRERELRARELYLRRLWKSLARQYRISQEELQNYTQRMLSTQKMLLTSPHWLNDSPFLVAPFSGKLQYLGYDPELGSLWVLLGFEEQSLILWSRQEVNLGADRLLSAGEIVYPQVIPDLQFELRIWNQIIGRGQWQTRTRWLAAGG